MKKVMNLTKAIGVFALLLLSQAVFAQKGGYAPSSTTAQPTPPTYTYVSNETAISRVEAKLYQLLGVLKQNQANPNSSIYTDALLRDDYYRMLLVYLQDGVAPADAVKATTRKKFKKDQAGYAPSTIQAVNLEALTLVRV